MPDNWDEIDFDNAQRLVGQRQRFSRRPKRPANVLAQLMARKGYAQQKSTNELEQVWQEIAADWKDQSKPGVIRCGVLEVLVANSLVNQQLVFEKKKLLNRLNDRLPQNKIRDIRFRTGNIH